MSTPLQGRKVAFLVAPEGAEQVELTDPWQAVTAAGAEATLVSTDTGTVQAFNHLDRGDQFDVDRVVDDVSADDFDALVLPGGVANPDQLRTVPRAVAFVKEFFNAGKPVAVICHGPWTLIEADVVAGRRITSWPSLQTDIRNAGGDWVDAEFVRCDAGPSTLLSSRKPDDLPAFCSGLVQEIGASAVQTTGPRG
ncbi:General stress protein 18 [Mycobacterium talmoniae]|uniref:General stress protein 18 n=1 Tax=Mycobacterium talmoniae TaxID=1858794 RepID=A0A2S8BJI8_9MYCO|nr:General stress protein 18 [Mycobacterium talmoniae]